MSCAQAAPIVGDHCACCKFAKGQLPRVKIQLGWRGPPNHGMTDGLASYNLLFVWGGRNAPVHPCKSSSSDPACAMPANTALPACHRKATAGKKSNGLARSSKHQVTTPASLFSGVAAEAVSPGRRKVVSPAAAATPAPRRDSTRRRTGRREGGGM